METRIQHALTAMMIIALGTLFAAGTAAAQQVSCAGCDNGPEGQYCNTYSQNQIWDVCEVEEGFCQGSGTELCQTFMYSELPADVMVSPAGTFLPEFENPIVEDSAEDPADSLVRNACTGYVTALEAEADPAPVRLVLRP